MQVSARVRVSGPLAHHLAGFTTRLTTQGYTDLSCAHQLRLLAHVSRWLERAGLSGRALTPAVVDRFLAEQRRTYVHHRSLRGMSALLSYLRDVGELPASPPASASWTEIEHRYERYMVTRGLVPKVRANYRAILRALLEGRAPREIDAAAIAAFVRVLVGRRRLAGNLSALRAGLRFLVVEEAMPANLSHVVPAARRWRQASLPQALDVGMVRAVLASCDRRTRVGRRDHAVLLLMLRLGLRAGEVAGLALTDIDWRAGEVVVHGKGGRIDRLPLPVDVGEVLVANLRRRHPTAIRALFLSAKAPIRAVTAGMVTELARQALRRAGVPTGGAHRLRHTAATWMLHGGATLTEIAQVLRHRSIDTTAIYAKVDRVRLGQLAPPWPTDVAIDRRLLRALTPSWPGDVARPGGAA